MKIKVLGCSGAEFPGYNPPGFLLDDEILFDAGSVTNVLDEKAQLKIRHIFITHAHLDHIRGIPFLADNINLQKRSHTINVLSISPVIKTIKKNLLNSNVWPDLTNIPTPHNAILKLKSLKEGRSIEINNYLITPYEVHHLSPAVGYLVENNENRRFFYTGDTGPSDTTWEKLKGNQIHCLIIEVSFPNSMEKMAIKTGHLTPQLLKKELLKMKPIPKRVYIIHIKPQYFRLVKREVEGLKMKNLALLKEGDSIRL